MAFDIRVMEEAGFSPVNVLVNQSDLVKVVKENIKKKMKLQDDDIIHMMKVKDNVKLNDGEKMSSYSVMARDLFSIKVEKPTIVPDSSKYRLSCKIVIHSRNCLQRHQNILAYLDQNYNLYLGSILKMLKH